MGHALALGYLPKFMLKDNLESIIENLMAATAITPPTSKWAEARRDCVKALCNIVLTLDDELENGKFRIPELTKRCTRFLVQIYVFLFEVKWTITLLGKKKEEKTGFFF